MADPFSIDVSVTDITDVSNKIISHLEDVRQSSGSSDEELERTIQELRSLETVCQRIAELCRKDEILVHEEKHSAACAIRIQIKAVLTECVTALQDSESSIKTIVKNNGSVAFDGVRLALRSQATDAYGTQLRPYVSRQCLILDVYLTITHITSTRLMSVSSSQSWSEVSSLLRSCDVKLEEQIRAMESRIDFSWLAPRDDKLRAVIEEARVSRKLTTLNDHFMIPRALSKVYKGRHEDLENLKNAYLEVRYSKYEKRFVIHGPGGSGKTEFCCRFADNNRHLFWGVFYVDASNASSESASFAEIARVADVEPTARAVKHWLSVQQRPWLLVVDDLDGFIGTGSRDRFFSDCGNGLVLITTRDSSLRTTGTLGKRGLSLTGLGTEDSTDLFLTAAGLRCPYSPDAIRQASMFCAQVDHVPLALVNAGTAIRREQCTLETCHLVFESCLERVQNRIDKLNLYSGSASYEAVFATFEMNCSAVSRDAQELLKVMSFMHRNNFPLEILIQAVINVRLEARAEDSAKPSPTSKSNASAAAYAKDVVFRLYNFFAKLGEKPVGTGLMSSLGNSNRADVEIELHAILSLLEKAALIQHFKVDESYSMHPLHHWWVRESMTLPERAVWCCVARDVLANVILLPPLGMSEEYAQLRRRMLPHIEHVKEQELIIQAKYQENLLARSKLWPSTKSTFGRSDIRRFAKFAMVYAENGQWKEASELLVVVDEFLTSKLGDGNSLTIKSRLFLSETYFWQAREDDALQIQRDLLKACQRNRGEEDLDTLAVMDKLGFSLWMKGDFIGARDFLERAVAGFVTMQPGGSMAMYTAMTHLGRAHGKMAEWDEAVDLNTEAFEGMLDVSAHGQAAREILDAKESAAMARLDRHRYTQSVKDDLKIAYHLQREVYSSREKLFGKEHPLTLYACCNFARIKAARGDVFEAEQMMREGVPIAERNLGKDNLGTLFGRTFLANILMLAGKITESEEILSQVVNEHERRRRNHPDQLVAAAFLLECYSRQGKLKEARRMHDKVISGVNRLFGPKSWWEAYFVENYKILEDVQLSPHNSDIVPVRLRMPSIV